MILWCKTLENQNIGFQRNYEYNHFFLDLQLLLGELENHCSESNRISHKKIK